jgi:CheY-like chemotaxis protein
MPRVTGPGTAPEFLFLPVQILVVDDDARSRRGMVRVLEQRGYSAVEAASGEEALALLEQTHIPVDLVLTDVQMPGLGGEALVARVRALWPRMPVLYVSGDETFAALAEEGVPATRFLSKPFTPHDLAQAIEQLLVEVELEA